MSNLPPNVQGWLGLTPSPSTAAPAGPSPNVLPIGGYLVAGMVAIALSNTRAAPVVVAFLTAAAIYQSTQLVNKINLPSAPPSTAGGGGGRVRPL